MPLILQNNSFGQKQLISASMITTNDNRILDQFVIDKGGILYQLQSIHGAPANVIRMEGNYISVKSLPKLSDGLQDVFLTAQDGRLVQKQYVPSQQRWNIITLSEPGTVAILLDARYLPEGPNGVNLSQNMEITSLNADGRRVISRYSPYMGWSHQEMP